MFQGAESLPSYGNTLPTSEVGNEISLANSWFAWLAALAGHRLRCHVPRRSSAGRRFGPDCKYLEADDHGRCSVPAPNLGFSAVVAGNGDRMALRSDSAIGG